MTDPPDCEPEKLFPSPYDEACFQRGKIEHEDELVNHRLLWLTTSQSIFFAAYVFGFSEPTGWPSVFRRALPPIAIVTCTAFLMGLIAAMRAATQVRRTWNWNHARYQDALDAVRGRRADSAGSLPGLCRRCS